VRRSRIRRRSGLVLTLMLLLSIALFVEYRIGSLAPALKESVEIRLEEALGDNYQISIGSIEGGLMRPLMLMDCRIRDRRKSSFIDKLEFTGIRSDLMLWNLVRAKDRNESRIDVDFISKDRSVAGFVRLEGNLSRPAFKGYLEFYGKNKTDFTGRADKDSFEFEVKVGGGNIRGGGKLTAEGGLISNLRIAGVPLFGHSITCDILVKNETSYGVEAGGRIQKGDVRVGNLMVGLRPFYEVRGSYRIQGDMLSISGIDIGDDFKIAGRIFFGIPRALDIVITADNANFNQILDLAGAKNSASVISGILNGRFALKGTLAAPKLDARMEIKKGTILTIDFDHLSAVLKGDGPIIRIEDSRIARQSGVMILAGEIDLRKMGKGSIFDDIRLETGETALNWDGVDTNDRMGLQEILMKKKMTEDINFGFKKYVNNGMVVDESVRESDEYQLEYKIHPHDSIKVMIGQDKDFFGLEHKDRF